MTDKIELPDYLKDITDESAKDMVSIGGSVPRISIRGRQFRFIEDGDEIHKQTDPINVIILGIVPKSLMAKTFYINGYQPGATDPPDCSSFFGEVPDNWVESPQAVNCRDCDKNKWGSATSMSGKKAKACKDSKRLMVVRAEDVKKENYTVYIFNVTIASLRGLTDYGKFLISNKLPTAAVITSISFVDSDFPQVEFNFVAVLNKENGLKMLEHAHQAPWMADQALLENASKAQDPVLPHTPSQQSGTPMQTGTNPPPPNEPPPDMGNENDILNNW